MSFFTDCTPHLSGERFTVFYRIIGDQQDAYAKAKDICLEQTVEFPEDILPAGVIHEQIVGRIESFRPFDANSWLAEITYAVETSAFELVQLLNVIFGNVSLKPGIRVEHLELGSLLHQFKGPRYGIRGLRHILQVPARPLLFTALKPMGLPTNELTKLAYQFALGGIDMIKDDHGLSDQPFSPYSERVKACVNAVHEANSITGKKSIYIPNITAPYGELHKRALIAKQAGAGGIMISPGLAGLEAMREIAEDDQIALPVIAHPAFLGSYVLADSGISHKVMFAEFARLAGADVTIFPNFGGRFSFTRDQCARIAHGSSAHMGDLRSIFPCPAGGMSLDNIPESLQLYGNDVIFLIGGGLFKHGPDLVENSQHFLSIVESSYKQL